MKKQRDAATDREEQISSEVGEAIAGRVSPARLRRHLERIIGERHHATAPRHHREVAEYIARVLDERGWPVTRQRVEGPHGVGDNLIARRGGTERRERSWILGAHYDSVIGTPGADDNGVAVAAVLEIAEILGDTRFRDTVDLAAWDMEEEQSAGAGALLGSTVMADEASRAGQDIAGVFDLEMIGLCRREPDSQNMPPGFGLLFPGVVRRMKRREMRGDFIAAVGDHRSGALLASLERAAGLIDLPFVPLPVKGPARLIDHFFRSDHAPFWRHGYPAVMITDTAEFRGGHYHRASDTIETIDFDFAADVTRATVIALCAMAGARPG